MFVPSLAWRDSRKARRRLLLYIAAMALGVAALVAVRSFGANLQAALGEQARAVFGADLQVWNWGRFHEGNEALVDSVVAAYGAEVAREVTTSSMALFPESGGTRLVQIRALRGDFPFYGEIQTTPDSAAAVYQARGEALADAALMLQYDAEVGDSIRIGQRTYRIAGRLDGITGQTDVEALVGPRVYLPLDALDPGLLGFGARYTTSAYFRLPEGVTADSVLAEIRPRLTAMDLRGATVSEMEGDWGDALGDLTRFLELVGFVALLLGGLGVASAISVYVRQKAETVATLRCLGATAGQTLRIYTLQTAVMGLLGALLGAALGVAVQQALPRVLGPFLPVEVATRLVWEPVLVGVGVGVAVALLFALLPLVRVRRIPPLRAIRADAEARGFDVWPWLLGAVLLAGVGYFARVQTGDPRAVWAFPLGVLVAFGVLALAAKLVQALVRLLVPRRAPYVWRQGLANLYRPGNQTLVLLLTLGLGTFLLTTLGLVERTLLAPIALPAEEGARPDLVLFDIQSDQREAVRALVREHGLPVLEEAPIVPMRLTAINGRSTEEIRMDTTAPQPTWALTRQYRSTYRGRTVETEQVTAGRFVGRVPADTAVVPVSVELDLANDLAVGLGDRLTWEVAGRAVETAVASLRRVDWARVQPNFFVVFPEGPLDDAPQFGILMTRAGSPERSAALQRAAVERFPNVSAVDVSLVLGLVEGILDRVAFVLQFMALFSVGTGLVVLAGAVRIARLQRIEEGVLLRTLGASRGQVRRILVAEYLFLGLLAALTGIALAAAAGWGLARFVFETPFVVAWGWVAATLLAVPALTVVVGLAGSRGLLARPPLDVLRAEVG
ncbi:MAG TPA: FtsX-like permease family protein [Rubricoccaceae bacterium]|nr:FtsX-like permease family protein [Rubricoccaceae bacterium]